MFETMKWKSVYRSGDQNLLKDFYQPCLKHAVTYDRAVGFFSAASLISNLQGISALVNNDGKMRLVIGHPLEKDEYEAVKNGYELKQLLGDLKQRLISVIDECEDVKGNKLVLLSWLISEGRLDVKFACRFKGMYHEKIGIVRDADNQCIVFQGSANETVYALDKGYNAESIMVFKSWESAFEDYAIPCINGFEELWEGKQKDTVTIDMPSDFYEEISDKIQCTVRPDLSFEQEFITDLDDILINEKEGIRIPEKLNAHDFKLHKHQNEAIKKWWSSDKKGILQLATGSGKTITSLAAASYIFDVRQRLVLIVTVPYKELATQWVSNLKDFTARPIKCWDSKGSWSNELESAIRLFKMGKKDFISIVVVNKTLSSDYFKEAISQINSDDLMVIGDECHNLGAEKVNAALPSAYFKLGLSATPFRSDEDEIDSPFPDLAKERILNYFGEIVDKYTLEDAICDGVLCEYTYHIIPVRLTEEEQELFDQYSLDIAKLMIIQQSSGLDSQQRSRLTALCGQRSMLLGSASEKFIQLKKLAFEIPQDERTHTLFYCGAGKVQGDTNTEDEKVIERASAILNDAGWRTSRFTSEQNANERKIRMEQFEAEVLDGLVSIRVLDEGVDVPVCKRAVIMASTRNPRQYVQRRGRVLRKSVGKEVAEIYDFVVLPNNCSISSSSRSLLDAELERVDDFCLLAVNKFDVENKIRELGMRAENDY